jgi:hypothetical protein
MDDDAPDPDEMFEPDHPVEVLRRWQASGAIWRVLHRLPDRLEIVLLTCTGDEEMGRVVSSDPAVSAFVGDRESSEA